jgi:hypothetical protein
MALKTLTRASLLTTALLLAGGLSLTLASSADAQERKITISRDKLPPVTWFKAPWMIDIVDERPRVNDLRTSSNAPSYEITIPPLAGNQSTAGPYRNLSPVNLNGSNINKCQTPNRNLPPATRPIYAMNKTAAPLRPVAPTMAPGRLTGANTAKVQPSKSPALTYADSNSFSSPIFTSSTRTFCQRSKAEVRGKLLKN